MDKASRAMSGTFGEVWLDDDWVGEISGFNAKITGNYQDVQMTGVMATDRKLTSITIAGALTMHKVNSRMADKVGRHLAEGKDNRVRIIGKLDDPDAYGAERVEISNVSFDEITLMDWKGGELSEQSSPFRATSIKMLDTVKNY